jgi:two-component system NarL family sensor kinase
VADRGKTNSSGVAQELTRARTEIEKLSARLHAETAERRRLEAILHTLPNRILEAQDSERQRIARELHDGVNQILGSIKFRLAHLESQLPAHAPALAEAIQLLERTLNEVRRISQNLRPQELDDFGLAPAIESLISEFQKRARVRVEFQRGPLPRRLPEAVELALYRILQEALANVEKHAGATEVTVALLADEKFATLNVRDDGRGFATGENKGGFGMITMRERATALGGVFSIQSRPGDGTEISVHVKLEN